MEESGNLNLNTSDLNFLSVELKLVNRFNILFSPLKIQSFFSLVHSIDVLRCIHDLGFLDRL